MSALPFLKDARHPSDAGKWCAACQNPAQHPPGSLHEFTLECLLIAVHQDEIVVWLKIW